MAFLESPRFPFEFLAGLVGGPSYSTDIVIFRSGADQTNANWEQSLGEWNGDGIPFDESKKAILLDWVHALKGRAIGFRYRDTADYTDAGRGILGSGAGTGLPTYPLIKRYSVGGLTTDRKIQKPAGLIHISRNGTLVAYGSGAGQVSLSSATGIVTFQPDASAGVSSISPGASTGVTLSAAIGLAIGQKLYLSGLSGTLGAALNGQAWPISAVSGAVYTLAVNTSALTGVGGTGAKYPQATDTLAWTGSFDVPVRFASDSLKLTEVSPGVFVAQGLALKETRSIA